MSPAAAEVSIRLSRSLRTLWGETAQGRSGSAGVERLAVSPSRLHALIDGVFAIALTLLVLDLPKPIGSARLAHDLLHQWPTYVAYLVSFVTVGILWIEHHG
jgi:hypothetical protein